MLLFQYIGYSMIPSIMYLFMTYTEVFSKLLVVEDLGSCKNTGYRKKFSKTTDIFAYQNLTILKNLFWPLSIIILLDWTLKDHNKQIIWSWRLFDADLEMANSAL